MSYFAAIHRRLHWLNLPGALLIALLQRTPIIRVAASAGNFVLSSTAGNVLKAAASTLGALGAVHSMAGATTLSASTPSPASGTVGTVFNTVVFSVKGAQSAASSWTVNGGVPPGLSLKAYGTTTVGVTSGLINNASTLQLDGTPTSAGQFLLSLTAWESAGAKNTSTTFTYVINIAAAPNSAPTISTQPTSKTVPVGGTAQFTSAASGSPTPTLQWFKGSTAIAGATSTILTISGATSADAATYTLVATNSQGSATSNAVTLTVTGGVTAGPTITSQPTDVNVSIGGSATFTAFVSGLSDISYKWYKNNVELSGANSPVFTISSVNLLDVGIYNFTAKDSSGSVTSSGAALTINSSPVIITQPNSQTLIAGANASFTVSVSGTPPPIFQWKKNGLDIPGQTDATLSLINIQSSSAGIYTVIATNLYGSATSNAATLSVNVPPVITAQPSSQTVSVGANVTFSLSATGSPSPVLQWKKNGLIISGQTNTTLTLTNIQTSDQGSYTCVATNLVGSVTSSTASLSINSVADAPVITAQPVSITASVGTAATLSVVATGSPSYQWRKNGVFIPGATNSSLSFLKLLASDTATYDVVATNASGTVMSPAATLIVTSALASRLSNLSVRTTLSGNQILTVGLTMSGGVKPVLFRAAGPTLGGSPFNIPGTMSDPKLAIFDGPNQVDSNDNWGGISATSVAIAAVGAFPFSSSTSLDAATVTSIQGGRTVQVSGPSAGNLIVEAYDIGVANSPRLTNLSALNFVGTGGDVLIAGFTVAGSGSKNLLIRAVGPSLAASPFNIGGTLVDPKLTVRNSTQDIVGENDNYSLSLASVFSSVGAFGLVAGAKDAALLISLPASPGGAGYTVTVSGSDGGTGLSIVEVYELP
ncbi:MAG: immunoglobulin domain-containing protein [Opitutaceae bacterium]